MPRVLVRNRKMMQAFRYLWITLMAGSSLWTA